MLRPIRDNDILLTLLTSEIAEEPAMFASQAETLVRRAIAERNAEAWAHIKLWLERKQSIRLVHRLDEFIADPPVVSRQHGTAARLLPAMVAGAWMRTRKLAEAVSANPDDAAAIDRLRRSVKAVRFSSELAGAALGDDPVVFAAAVEDVQEALGEHRNALLVGEFLVNLAGDPRTSGRAGFLYGRLHAIADSNVLGAIDDFADAWDRANDAELTAWLR
jgi:CHAD domain-containing protein